MSRHLVFVYGTLRRGGPNHTMLAECDYLGRHDTGYTSTLSIQSTLVSASPRVRLIQSKSLSPAATNQGLRTFSLL
ncbi:MAG: hypothetical protein MAG794_00342 [Gammaproteobacteria bacterium]|nr:hypothetical protein [Gammaproteobacteria bacterium]